MSKIGARLKISSYRTYVRNSLSLNWIRSCAREIYFARGENQFERREKYFQKEKKRNIFINQIGFEMKSIKSMIYKIKDIVLKRNSSGRVTVGSKIGRMTNRCNHRTQIGHLTKSVLIGWYVGSS